MKRHVVILFALIAFAATAWGQSYPADLAGVQAVMEHREVALEVAEVVGCPYSHADATGNYYLARMQATHDAVVIELLGYYSPAGVQIGSIPPGSGGPFVIPWDESAHCYLSTHDPMTHPRFEAVTFYPYPDDRVLLRTGYFIPQTHCCPWYQFDDRQCLWVFEVRKPVGVREDGQRPQSTK